MTDKEQIIIDGIDVSGCEHHRKCILPDNIGCKIDDFLCCDKPNCNYKQLKRKEQECEELKKEQLEIKKYLGISHKSILERLEELQERRDELSEKNISYEQALDEIAAHYQKVIKNITNYDDSYDASISIKALHNISDIINKAKGEGNAV